MPIRLLIIRFSALGDNALLVPVVREWAMAHPAVEVTVLSRIQYSALWSDIAPNIHFAGASFQERHNGRQGLDRLMEDISWRQFDAVADMHDVWRSRYITLRMRLAGKRVACVKKDRLGRFLLTHGLSRRPLKPMWQRYSDVLAAVSGQATTSNEPHIIDNQRLERSGIGIAPFAAHRGKQYPTDKMEEVVKQLSAAGYPITLFGGRGEERDILHRWATLYPNTISAADSSLSLKDETAMMGHLRLMVSMDSANMHLASLCGTRVISIWGATHPAIGFLGIGQQQSDCIQKDLSCRPCSAYGKKKCRYGDYHCLTIEPEEIVKKVKETYEQ